MNYSEALTYLDSFVNYEVTPEPAAMRAVHLERMTRLLEMLGHPERAFRAIHVAGTKGKGSIAAMVASVLGAVGYRAGLYTSPHLETVRERIHIAGQGSRVKGQGEKISEAMFAETLTKMQPALEHVRCNRTLGPLTYFEVLTAMACVYFAEQRCVWAVLEAGLGGRLDATNAVLGEAVVFSPISLDHVEILGSTIAAIAREKSGFVKQPHQCVVSSPQTPDAGSVLWSAAQRCGARYFEQGREFTAQRVRSTLDGTTFDIRGEDVPAHRELTTALLGSHQAENAATAVALLTVLAQRGLVVITQRALHEGLAAVQWPGRLELIQRQPDILLDGAQNVASAQALKRSLEHWFPGRPLTLILGISSNKDIEGIVATLAPGARHVMVTQAQHPRAATAEQLAAVVERYTDCWTAHPTVSEAMQAALMHAGTQDVIVVTGSLFVVGEVRKYCAPQSFAARN